MKMRLSAAVASDLSLASAFTASARHGRPDLEGVCCVPEKSLSSAVIELGGPQCVTVSGVDCYLDREAGGGRFTEGELNENIREVKDGLGARETRDLLMRSAERAYPRVRGGPQRGTSSASGTSMGTSDLSGRGRGWPCGVSAAAPSPGTLQRGHQLPGRQLC